MKNRYGKEYWFEQVSDKTYRFHMEEDGTKYMRMGGREGQDKLDMEDIGFFDPAGGPFVCVGEKIFWDEISGGEKGEAFLTVKRIMNREDGIYVEV